jgi:hypothetical protein
MAAKDIVTTLEEFLNLVPGKIDRIAEKFRTKPIERIGVAELLDGLSETARQAASGFLKALRSLTNRERDEFLAAFERAGMVNTAKVLTTALKSSGIMGNCLALHEAAKTLETAADFADILEQKSLALFLKSLALAADIAAQVCDDYDAQQQERKINFIMDLPENWGWDIPPVADDETPTSLTMVRKLLEGLQQKIDFIMDLPVGGTFPAVPLDETPTSLTTLRKLLEVAKKFYKFEGFFVPSFSKDKQLIRIGPLASTPTPNPPIPILVTGFIDLSGMQDYDVVTITTKVLEPSPSPHYAIWRVKTFTGRQASGMKHFQDFADLLEVPGDGVEFLIAQSASAHNFDPGFLLTIPYQFLVETTVLPLFSVS